MGDHAPPGYKKVEMPIAGAVVLASLVDDFADALRAGTLYDFARSRSDATSFRGRGDAFAFRAPLSGEQVLVRRSRHGGFFAPVTGQIFFKEGRAPRELRTSIELRQRGIPTPEVLGYAVYPVAALFCRVDVAVRFLPDSRDLASIMADADDSATRAALTATVDLMRTMSRARVLHPDLNLRNILVARGEQGAAAWLLDVDRVRFDRVSEDEVWLANMARFGRSLLKLQRLGVIRGDRAPSEFLLTTAARR
jgi:hypothetical protein